jgi:CDK-activating kinase assembly factor MAT1
MPPAFNLLNDTDVAETEAKLAAYQDTNASLIATNKQKTATENMSQTERNEAERQARAERVRMIEDAEKFEKAEEVRIKKDITEAIDRGNKDAITEIQAKAAKAKADRAAALAASVPPSLAALLAPAATEEMHPPTSPAYAGPYVAIPYDDPDTAPERGWYTLKNDYADGRSGVVWAKEDREGRVRGGGWDINLFWEMEVRSSVEALSLEPLR